MARLIAGSGLLITTVLITTLLWACGPSRVPDEHVDSAISSKSTVVFNSVEGEAAYRIPTLAQLGQESIVLIVEKRFGGANRERRVTSVHADGGNVSLVGKLSSDAGKTWGEELDLVSHEDVRKMLTTRYRDYSVRPTTARRQEDVDEIILGDHARFHMRLVDPTVVTLAGDPPELLVVFRAMYNTLYDEDDRVWNGKSRLHLNDLGHYGSSVRNTFWAAHFSLDGSQLRRISLERLDETVVAAALRSRGLVGQQISVLYRRSFLGSSADDFLAAQKSWRSLYGTMVSGTSAAGEDVLIANPRGVYHHLNDLRLRCYAPNLSTDDEVRCRDLFQALMFALHLEPAQLTEVRADVQRFGLELRQLLTSAKRLGPGKGWRLGTRIELAAFPVHLSASMIDGGIRFEARPLPDLTTDAFKPNERALTTFRADANRDGRSETYALYSYDANVGPYSWRTAPDESAFRRGFGWGKFLTDADGVRYCSWAPPRPDPLIYDSIVVGGVATVQHEGQQYIVSATNYVRNLESEILCRKRTGIRCTEWDNRRMLTLTVGKADMQAEAGRSPSLRLSWYLTHNDCSRPLGPNSAQTVITSGSSGNTTLVHDPKIDPEMLHVVYEGHPNGEFTDLGFAAAVLHRSVAVADVVDRALRIDRLYDGCRPGT